MDKIQKAMMLRYQDLHPLLFKRSLEKAKSNGELFDLLESIKELGPPIVWDDENRKWSNTKDILQSLSKKTEPEE